MRENDPVIVAYSDTTKKALTIFRCEVIVCNGQDVGAWIQQLPVIPPLSQHVIGDHEHVLRRKAHAAHFHGRRDALKGFTGAYNMRGKSTTILNDSPCKVTLMRIELDLRIHPGKFEVTAIVFPEANIVQGVVV